MSAWPGGACPDCGDFMPPNLITCQTCRAMLNSDLKLNIVDVPDFIPLQEIDPCDLDDSDTAIIPADPPAAKLKVLQIEARGIYFLCAGCHQELKIPKQFMKSKIQCKHCSHDFKIKLQDDINRIVATYVNCPHCEQRIRASKNLTNRNIQCEHCHGAMHIKFAPSQNV